MRDNLLIEEMGARISARRKARGLSQEALAELVGVTPQMISTAERGTKALRPENLLKISRALCVSSDFLLTGETSAADAHLLVEKLRQVPPALLPLVESVLDHCLALK